jgi:hypothetical protein
MANEIYTPDLTPAADAVKGIGQIIAGSGLLIDAMVRSGDRRPVTRAGEALAGLGCVAVGIRNIVRFNESLAPTPSVETASPPSLHIVA